MTPVLFGHVDIAEIALWAFFLFFVGLVVYLRREDHREGYPMEEDSGKVGRSSLFRAKDKRFILAHNLGIVYKPGKREYEVPNPRARRVSPYAGAPLEPLGNPLVDGVGPASWCNRLDVPDMTWEGGQPKIVPLELTHGFRVARQDKNPIGMPVFGCDDKMAGVCTNVWVDQSERLIRYLEVRTMGDAGGAGRSVTVPMAMAQVNQRRGKIRVDAVRSDQFGLAPTLASPSQITRLEEEKVVGYFGGGYLYAKRSRMEPFL